MKEIKEIERSIIKTYRRQLWANFVKALDDYNLLSENDKVCICVILDAKSMLSAKLFAELYRHSKIAFTCYFIALYDEHDITKELLTSELNSFGLQMKCINIAVNDKNKIRDLIKKEAIANECTSLCYYDTYDDVTATTLSSILYHGCFRSLLPLEYDEEQNLKIIRPLYLIKDNDIIKWAKFCEFSQNNKLMISDCEEQIIKDTKELINNLSEYNNLTQKNIFSAPTNVNLDMMLGYVEKGIHTSYLEKYDNKK